MEAVQRSLDAWNRGDVDGMLTRVTDDTEYAIAEQNPNARLLRGREELAAYLRVDHKTVYAAIQEGSIPGVKRLGRTIRIYRPAVLEWAVKEEARKRR